MRARPFGGLVTVVALGLLVPVVTSCGGGEAAPVPSTSAAGQASEQPGSEPAASMPAASMPASMPAASEPPPAAGGIPDACELIDAVTLTSLTGTDNGQGTSGGEASAARRYCIYPTGLSTSITRGTEFDTSVTVMRTDPNLEKIADLPGLGEQAVIGTYAGGAVRQVMALQGDTFVTVTGALTKEQATATAQAMLDAL